MNLRKCCRQIQFFIFFYFDDLHLQIIERISPKTSVENSFAQWVIFFFKTGCTCTKPNFGNQLLAVQFNGSIPLSKFAKKISLK